MDCSPLAQYKNYEYVKKLMQRMKANNFINVYRCAFNKKNYYFLTSKAEKFINQDQKASLSEETYYHDAMVSSICVELSKIKPFVEKVELEHIIKNGSTKNSYDEIIPDARIKGMFNDKSFLIAIEVEIHQKEKSRILLKAKSYLKNTLYDYVFYFFPDERLMNNYAKILKNEIGEEFNEKIFLFIAPRIFCGKNSLENGTGIINGNFKNIFELFGVVP
jgi:DNA-binding MarR family transcriptional regulator